MKKQKQHYFLIESIEKQINNRETEIVCSRTNRRRKNTTRFRYEREEEEEDLDIMILTVGLLEPSASTATTELLGLAAPGVGDEESAIVPNEDVLDLLLGLFVHVLLVEGD